MADFIEDLEESLLSDDTVAALLDQVTPIHRLFLAGLGRGMSPAAAALRAGWKEEEAGRMAEAYMTTHPVVSRLAAHILTLRELATLDGEEPVFKNSGSIH